ncbi:hypothetical protein Pint_03672 [Pistacia integerrima]|uniref:Uncharacterized protein n=1 Tax=Pistacia integerrima TaxID=434235 RepID=A0ACC0Z393_9ROSI|nr:hypothetical protein Pint_03672 [Pistacia integerrima]
MCRFQCSSPLDVEYWISVSESEGVDSPKQLFASRNAPSADFCQNDNAKGTGFPFSFPPFDLHPNPRLKSAFPQNSTRYSGRNKRNPCPSAVSYAAEESTAVGTLGGSLYEVLRVHPTASLTEIKMAYRNLAKVYHPDLSGERTSDGRDFIEIHNAYATLSDPAARAVYDLSLAGRNRRRLQTAPFGFSGRGGFYPTRRWETDQCW